MLQGDPEEADDLLAAAAESPRVRVAALAERALIATARDDHGEAESLALAAHSARDGQADAARALALAVSARALLRSGRWTEARAELAAAEKLTPLLTHALPWLAVQTLLELTRACLTLRDAEGASSMLGEATKIIRRRPHLGPLVTEAEKLSGDVDDLLAARLGRESGLTAAELRLLPLLSTHLTFREIGARFLVSRNTVKTQAISVYRKLGVSSRSEAITAASRLGLVPVSSGADDAVA
jgi:LuxR family maltose regulon positive regulatory protein